MKTYSRKKTGALGPDSEEVIIDLNEICRLCMNKEDELMPIYTSDDAVPLTLKIMACVSLEVFEGDGLPDKICRPCKYQLEKAYTFRKKCENSDLKLRLHLRDLPEDEYEKEDSNMQTEENYVEITEEQLSEQEEDKPSTEQDLVGITKVAYIQQEQEEGQDPENITLPKETDELDKQNCTLKTNLLLKPEVEKFNHEVQDNIYKLEEDGQNYMEETDIDVIADAVKATLANQAGLNLEGPMQMKLNQSEGKSTHVEVTTEDGSVIIMELLTEEAAESVRPPMEQDFNGEALVFQCPNCPKSFSRRIQLKRHASVHMSQKGFSCGICEKWFPSRSALVRHERSHTGERPFQCEACQKSFAQKEILYRHLMTHTGQKPFMCPHCNKGFAQKEPLRIHMRTHIAVSPEDLELHYCTLCPKVFCHASGLSRHLLSHTGKTFRCTDCEKAFTDKSSLKRHLVQTGHGDEIR